MKRPAILGGPVAFPDGLPLARPATPPLAEVVTLLQPSWDRGVLTNGPLVRQLEEAAASRLGVRNVVAVSSCTAGLMLVFQALGTRGSVVLPSFTFSASAHALMWNQLAPVFAECDESTFHIDVDDAAARVDQADASAVLATHVFGAPGPVGGLDKLGQAAGVPVVFDAAHAFGATLDGQPVGHGGVAEVFSLTPTKTLVAGEGGLVATADDDLAEALRWNRDYGHRGDYNTRVAGLNARMSEMHAATALAGLPRFDDTLAIRRSHAARYTETLADIPGIHPQTVGAGDESTYKDFTVSIDPEQFGTGRDELEGALRAEGVETRRYFYPPVHRQDAYRAFTADLPVTDRVAGRVLTLPLYATMPAGGPEQVAELIAAVHAHADQLTATSTPR